MEEGQNDIYHAAEETLALDMMDAEFSEAPSMADSSREPDDHTQLQENVARCAGSANAVTMSSICKTISDDEQVTHEGRSSPGDDERAFGGSAGEQPTYDGPLREWL